MISTGYAGPTTPDMEPLVGIRLTKVNVLRRLEPAGTSLSVFDLKRRMAGATVDEIKEALRESVAEGMVESRSGRPTPESGSTSRLGSEV